jgi:hypothetical protein
MACFKITVTVIDPSSSPGEAGKSWKYTFYTTKDPATDRVLKNAMSDPLSIISNTKTNKKVRGFKQCKIQVKEYAKNGSWTVSYDPDPSNPDGFRKPTTPYETTPPWGNIDVTYDSSSDQVADGTCDQDFTAQVAGDGDYFPDTSTDCQCPFGDSGLANFSGSGFGPMSQSFNIQSTPTMADFIDYIEGLQSSCLSNGGLKFTLQFSCLPKNIILEPFSLPTGWNTLSDAQKINFLNSKVTLIQQALGNSYYQQISVKTNCLKSAGTIINGHIYKQ